MKNNLKKYIKLANLLEQAGNYDAVGVVDNFIRKNATASERFDQAIWEYLSMLDEEGLSYEDMNNDLQRKMSRLLREYKKMKNEGRLQDHFRSQRTLDERMADAYARGESGELSELKDERRNRDEQRTMRELDTLDVEASLELEMEKDVEVDEDDENEDGDGKETKKKKKKITLSFD